MVATFWTDSTMGNTVLYIYTVYGGKVYIPLKEAKCIIRNYICMTLKPNCLEMYDTAMTPVEYTVGNPIFL